MKFREVETTKGRNVKKTLEAVGLVKKIKTTKSPKIEKTLEKISLVRGGKAAKSCKVKRALETICLEDGWQQGPWKDVKPLELKNYMGSVPVTFPKTRVKLLYDKDNIYVHFHVEDQYVLAKANKHQDPVYEDSCVEFFFTPSHDLAGGYFNIEVNCCGVILMSHQLRKDGAEVIISNADLGKINMYTSLKEKSIPVEIVEPLTWRAAYKLPFEMLEKYAKVERPAKGVEWRVNFYKCADEISFPHWLTWSKIDKPFPDFHQPSFFGKLEFE